MNCSVLLQEFCVQKPGERVFVNGKKLHISAESKEMCCVVRVSFSNVEIVSFRFVNFFPGHCS